MGRKGSKKQYAELVSRLVEIGARNLVQCGLGDAQARQAMREIAHALASEYGGTSMYVPKDQEMTRTLRDMEIYERLRNDNASVLALEYKLSEQQIYSIYKYVRVTLH